MDLALIRPGMPRYWMPSGAKIWAPAGRQVGGVGWGGWGGGWWGGGWWGGVVGGGGGAGSAQPAYSVTPQRATRYTPSPATGSGHRRRNRAAAGLPVSIE